ncbi:MAG TPA: hypothetical protein VF426_05630 [Marmoricola sp.]
MRRVLLVVLGAVLVNLPLVHSAYVEHRISTEGRHATATVKSHEIVEGRYFVHFQVPDSKGVYSARVSHEAYDDALASGEIAVTVVPGHPNENRVRGEIDGHAFVVLAVIGDLFLLSAIVALVMLRRRKRRRTVLIAESDVVPCDGGPVHTDLGDGRARVHGVVVDVGPGWVDLRVDDAVFHVLTGELRCRADLRQIASVVGTEAP